MTDYNECKACYNVLKDKYGLKCAADCDFKTMKTEVKKLYLKHHPDKGGDPAKFREIRDCAVLVINQKCTEKFNIKDLDNYCNREFFKYTSARSVSPKCVRNKKNPNYKVDKCPKGSYYRKGYEIPAKCIDDKKEGESELEECNRKHKRYMSYMDRAIKQQRRLICIVAATIPYGRMLDDDIDGNPCTFKIMKIYTPPPGNDQFKDMIFNKLSRGREIYNMDQIMKYYKKHGYYFKYIKGNPCKKTQVYDKDSHKCVQKKCVGGRKNQSKVTGKCLKPCKSPLKRSPNGRCKKL
jgi:hypothetical protein